MTVFENASKCVKRALNVKKIVQNQGKMFKNGRKRAVITSEEQHLILYSCLSCSLMLELKGALKI